MESKPVTTVLASIHFTNTVVIFLAPALLFLHTAVVSHAASFSSTQLGWTSKWVQASASKQQRFRDACPGLLHLKNTMCVIQVVWMSDSLLILTPLATLSLVSFSFLSWMLFEYLYLCGIICDGNFLRFIFVSLRVALFLSFLWLNVSFFS